MSFFKLAGKGNWAICRSRIGSRDKRSDIRHKFKISSQAFSSFCFILWCLLKWHLYIWSLVKIAFLNGIQFKWFESTASWLFICPKINLERIICTPSSWTLHMVLKYFSAAMGKCYSSIILKVSWLPNPKNCYKLYQIMLNVIKLSWIWLDLIWCHITNGTSILLKLKYMNLDSIEFILWQIDLHPY